MISDCQFALSVLMIIGVSAIAYFLFSAPCFERGQGYTTRIQSSNTKEKLNMSSLRKYNILSRTQIEVNTDPQRRCYNGCHFSSELIWTNWELLECNVSEAKIERRLEFWKELNDYAVSKRGKSAQCEYKAVETEEVKA